MKIEEIKVGSRYLNKSGRSERKILDRGPHIKVVWLGHADKEPIGEDGVLFQNVRLGKTHYPNAPVERPVYVSSFATWAAREVGI